MDAPQTDAGLQEALRQAVFVIDKLEAELETLQEHVAIVGMSCRFPGAASVDALWHVLSNGVDAITEVPPARWDMDELYDPDPDAHGKLYCRKGGFVDAIDEFDPRFFGISPKEAVKVDPQQRLLLEVAWEALERAGQAPLALRDSRTGVFVGIAENDYARVMDAANGDSGVDHHDATGTGFCFASGRLSHVLGLRGPNIAMDTGCSSSLVAIHQAAASLRLAECDLALAGGVHLRLSPVTSLALAKMRALSPDGRCKTFDAAADGFGRSEGCGVIVLKRLSDAQRDADTILAVIRGSAINHDGPASGFTVPSERAQVDVIRDALVRARVRPHDVGYIEAHGTGTRLGDPIEVSALGEVFGDSPHDVLLGSIKTNLGHTEGAAGVAGVIKAVLALQHGTVPPNLHFHDPSPLIAWDDLPFVVPTQPSRWPETDAPRIAGVSSFGMSGTNAHVVLEQAPPAPRPVVDGASERPVHLLALSARSAPALDELAGRYQAMLESGTARAEDVCFTANTGRSHFEHRLCAVGRDGGDLAARLASGDVLRGRVAAAGRAPSVAFLFTGQGAQCAGMGRALHDAQPAFAAALDRCAQVADGLLEEPLLATMLSGDRLDETAYTQPALFAFEYALAELWASWGILPDAVLGHSVGEYVAACVAGVFSLEDGLRLVCARGRLMQALPRGGAMASVWAGAETVAVVVDDHALLSIAAVNAPGEVVVSGDEGELRAALETLQARGIETKPLRVSHAFHSPLIEPMLQPFAAIAESVSYGDATIPLVSGTTGEIADPATLREAGYWVRHAREPIRFAAGARALAGQGISAFVEIGPKPVLLGLARTTLGDDGDRLWLPSVRPGSEWLTLLASLAELAVHGAPVDWRGFDRDRSRRIVAAPTYAFQRRRYWPAPRTASARPRITSLLGTAVRSPLHGATLFHTELDPVADVVLADHRICGEVVVPAAGHLAMVAAGALAAAGAAETALVIEDAVFPRSLALPDPGAHAVQLVIADDDGAFTVLSVNSGAIHAEGRVRVASENPTRTVPVGELRERMAPAIEADGLYARLDEQGIALGASLRWIDRAWTSGSDVLAAIARPRSATALAAVHPGLIDACFQATEVLAMGDGPRLPFAIERLRLRPGIDRAARWVHARRRANQGWDIDVLDEDGRVLLELTGFRDRPATPPGQAWQDWLAGVSWRAIDPPPAAASAVGRWLLVGDTGGPGPGVAGALRRLGVTCDVAPLNRADVASETAYTAVVLVAGGDARDVPARTLELTAALLRTTQDLARMSRSPRLTVLTCHARAVTTGEPVSAEQSALWGMTHAITAEHPELRCSCLDVDGEAGAGTIASLLAAADGGASDGTRRALRGATLYTEELGSMRLNTTGAHPVRLLLSEYGSPDDLRLVPLTRTPPGPGQVEIEVRAAGLNFRDVLISLGMLRAHYADAYGIDAARDVPLGFECAGVVAATGPGVTALSAGDPVIALAERSFASFVTVDARDVVALPRGLDFIEGASIPLAFLTAWHGLENLARLRSGERVLVHAASGGVGQAAVQLAHRAGAVVLATASPEKHDAVRALGVRHVMSSRTADFRDGVLAATDGHGVDVILNCLSGELIDAGVGCLTAGGRFVELGKLGIWDAARMRVQRPDVEYLPFDLGDESERDPGLVPAMLADLHRAFAAGELAPLPVTVHAVARATAAYDLMKRAGHIGKVVLAFDPPSVVRRRDASYLVTGGTGALGLLVAGRLAADGAGHIVLAGRRGHVPEAAIVAIERSGATVRVVRADVSDAADVARVLETCDAEAPLRGIVHAAGVLDDGVLLRQTAERLARVLDPKVGGAWNLHHATRDRALDFFVAFSSVAALTAAGGQSTYAAANAFLDGLMQSRHAAGLPGMSINWGSWEQVGMAALLEARRGTCAPAIAPEQGLDAFVALLASGETQVAVFPDRLAPAPAPVAEPASPGPPSWRERMDAGVAGERRALLTACVREQVAAVMGAPAGTSLDADAAFADLGLDSLMLVELRSRLQRSLDVSLPSTIAFDEPTIQRLARRLATQLGLDDPAPRDPGPASDDAMRAQLDAELALLAEEERAR